MTKLDLVLTVAAVVLFALATYPVQARFNLVAAGLCLLALTLLT
jgi:hypothetical protein